MTTEDVCRIVEVFLDARWKPSTFGNVFIRCPHPDHNDSSPSCHVSLEKLVFNCFACGAKGTLGYALKLKGAPPSVLDLLPRPDELQRALPPVVRDDVLDEAILACYDTSPEPWLAAGFSDDVLREHEIGFDRYNKRVTVPIRDAEGKLRAISGRDVAGADARYKVYRTELMDFMPHGYAPRVHDYLWRWHVASREQGPVIVTEGFKACMWLAQCGVMGGVALMGAQMSDRQAQLLADAGRPVWLMLDLDDAGRRGQRESAIKLYRRQVDVYHVCYAHARGRGHARASVRQPDDVEIEALYETLTNPVPHMEWTGDKHE